MKNHMRAFVRESLIKGEQMTPTDGPNDTSLSFDETKYFHFACVRLGEDDDGYNLALVHPITGMIYRGTSSDWDFLPATMLNGKNAEDARELINPNVPFYGESDPKGWVYRHKEAQ